MRRAILESTLPSRQCWSRPVNDGDSNASRDVPITEVCVPTIAGNAVTRGQWIDGGELCQEGRLKDAWVSQHQLEERLVDGGSNARGTTQSLRSGVHYI